MTNRTRNKPERDRPRNSDSESEVKVNEETPTSTNWEIPLNAILLDENKKIAKPTGVKIVEIFQKLQDENERLKLRIAYLEGRLDERTTIGQKIRRLS